MRSLLRSTVTGLYFESEEQWVADISQAHDFGSSARAIQFAVENRFKDVEVVLAYDDPHYNIAIPLTIRSGPQRGAE
jgi:hypothetical protein